MHGKSGNARMSTSPTGSLGLRRKVAKAGGHVLDSWRASVWLKDAPRRDALEGSSTSSLVDLPSASGGTPPKRPTSLSRHASAAGVLPRSLAVGQKTPTTEGPEGGLAEPQDIGPLLAEVAAFAERLEKLRDVVLQEGGLESRRPLAHECLGEALRTLRQIFGHYPLLKTLEALTAAGTLISRVKGFRYESEHEVEKREFEKAVEAIAVSFSSTVSEFLMGEVDNSTLLSIPLSDQSMESLYGGGVAAGHGGASGGTEGLAEEVDLLLLQKGEEGLEGSLRYAKNLSKYMKDLMGYLDKRTALEMDFAKGLQKMAMASKQSFAHQHPMPLLSIYSLSLEQDLELALNALQAGTSLRTDTFLQPLQTRRQEHEKRRKEVKEQWHRARRKLQEAENNLRKAKQLYMQRSEESQRAKQAAAKAEEEQQQLGTSGSSGGGGATHTKALEKKRRLEEEARNKAEEAQATYRTCLADANTQKQETEDTKVAALRQLHEVIRQSDLVIKTATISFYQLMQVQTAPLPVYFQTLCESSKLYDPGQQYASHIKQLQRGEEPEVQYDFEPYIAPQHWSPLPRPRKGSHSSADFASGSGTAEAARRGGRSHQVHKSWPSTVMETKDSPVASPGEPPNVPSNGSLSPADDMDGNSASFEESIQAMSPGLAARPGPSRPAGLSRAAQTHRLRRLRTPAKCRECNSYVYFQGAECEECSLACHKKCLDTLAIQCGHKRLQGKLRLFGQDFAQASRQSPDGVPFVIRKCVMEIEKRAMKTKGIYRVNGVKTRVEKLCQAFENGKELVELSQAPPHDVSNVLKLYLRQLPEPILPFRLYNSLVGLAKESLQGAKAGKGFAELEDGGAEAEATRLVTKLEALTKELPPENLATLRYLVEHLRRIVEAEQENKMTPGNLGIVFGPTLMRPRPTEATVSLSSLVDYPHQARIVEALIIFYPAIFEPDRLLGDGPARAEGGPEGSDGNIEHTPDQLHGEAPGLSDPGEVVFHGDDVYGESGARFIDSDSDLEDGAESGVQGVTPVLGRASESSGEETPSGDEGNEEGNPEGSLVQLDLEDVPAPRHPSSPAEGEAGEDSVFGQEDDAEEGEGPDARRRNATCDTSQSNNNNNTHVARLGFGCETFA